jgi:hypothetical protein
MSNQNGPLNFGITEKSTIPEVLEAAAKFLVKWGWKKKSLGGYQKPDKTYDPACTLGAITAVTRHLPYTTQDRKKNAATRRVRLAIFRVHGLETSIPEWNDLTQTTLANVLEVLKKAKTIR